MKSENGTYVLVLQSGKRQAAQVGKWGRLEIARGYYLYVGSAFGPGGVLSRVSRHCRAEKAKRWHVDYLREQTHLEAIWYVHSDERFEHRWARKLETLEETTAIKGFGCSDCRCLSHLFFVASPAGLTACRHALPGPIQTTACTDR
jgi:Uri superfamily endonuclease